MIVSTDSSRFRAISFGVFCRADPSTRAIMRSRNVCPGAAVMRTTIRSDSTFVPPVTALRSPPDSRMTGADSPVIADSSTEATPSTTSPSPGMISPASTTTKSPTFRCAPGMCSSWPSGCKRRATASLRALRRLSACARPRPSATASARVPNSTVSHSQMATAPANTDGSLTASTVVIKAPTHTTNMTGVRITSRGSSLRSACGRLRSSWPGPKAAGPLVVWAILIAVPPRQVRVPKQVRTSGRR